MKQIKHIVFLLVLLTSSIFSIGQDIVKKPSEQHLVNDFANMLTKQEQANLEQKLLDYFVKTSTQITVVTVATLNGLDPASYAYQVGEQWGIGKADFNNGIVVLLKPKTTESLGQAFIATGYGLEGVIPDAIAKQIVENEMIPYFKNGDVFGGVNRATDVLIDLTKGEYNYEQYAKQARGGGFTPFIVLLFLVIIFSSVFGKRRRGFYSAGNRSSLPFWLAMGMMTGNRNHHSGMFNDFNRGSGSFGGGGSNFGSFGGFGGGSFGGGGAGGSW